MKITTTTPRRRTINIVNDTFTIYNAIEDGFGPPRRVRAYSEWNRLALERKYGRGTVYKGLLVIDSTEGYVDEGAVAGFFTAKVGDKIVPFATDLSIKEVLAAKEPLYTIKDVSVYTIGGALLSVEVLCG